MADMKLFLELLLKNAGFRAGLDSSGKDVNRFTQGAQRGFENLRNSVQSVKGMMAGLGLGLGLKEGVSSAAGLQESLIDVRMSLMRSTLGAADLNRQLQEVRKTGVEVQAITPFSAQDVVQAERMLLESGLEFSEVVGKGAARAAMVLATIAKAPAKDAADAMLNIGIPYHLKSSEYGQVADVIQRHIMSGRMKLPELNAGLQYVAPIAKNFKVPWNDLLTGMAVLGEQGQLGSTAGTHLADFYKRLTGASRISRRIMDGVNADLRSKGRAPLEFWDKNGEMKSTEELIKTLRKSMGGYNTHQKMFFMEKIFGDQGMLAALALMSEGTGSWEFVKKKADEVAGSEEKMTERLKGFNASLATLQGTTKTSLANLFDPALDDLTKLTKLANNGVDAIGGFAEKHRGAAGAFDVAAIAGALVGGSVLYRYGSRFAKGLVGGVAGTAVGVAEGKALEKMAGVTPVFVTNWPAGMGGSAVAEAIGGAAVGAGGKKAAGWLARRFGVLAGSSMGLAATELLPFAIAGGVGYGTGWALNRGLGWLSGKVTGGKYQGEGWMGEQLYDLFHPESLADARRGAFAGNGIKNEIKLDVRIDKDGRVIAVSNNMDTSIDARLSRGAFDDAIMRPNL